MAISRQTLRLIDELRVAVSQLADHTTRKLVQAWARAWDELVFELRDAIDDLLAAGDGQWPARAHLMRASRISHALDAAQRALERLAERTRLEISRAAQSGAEVGARGQGRLIASQLPPAAGELTSLAVRFDRLSADTLAAIVSRTTQQITALSRPLSAQATEAMKRELIRGAAVGDNPRDTARRILRRVEGAFNGGLTRALVIARTEILDAHRTAAAAAQQVNADVLAGWRWGAQLDRRTCPSCWAQHGNVHGLDEPGPLDHQQGRCARIPVTKTWRQLGFRVAEPPDLLPDAQDVFRALPRADQLSIMGTARLALLNQGAIVWRDLSVRRANPGWRDSFGIRPVTDLERRSRPAA